MGRRRRGQRRSRSEKLKRCDEPSYFSLMGDLQALHAYIDIQPVCCIYHKPKAVGESSDESSSDSDDSSSGSDSEDGAKRKAMDADRARDSMRGRRKGKAGHGKRKPSPNAYEKVPKDNSKGKGKEIGASEGGKTA